MRSSSLLAALLLVSAATACGGGGGTKDKPDAFIVTDGPPIDNPPPPPGCDYGELHDDTNDDADTTGFPEDTQITFGTSAVFCGKLNKANYDTMSQHIDADGYKFTIATDGEYYVQIYSPGLEALGEVDVGVYGTDDGTTYDNGRGSGIFLDNHGAASVPLTAGSYEIYVSGFNDTAPAADVAYKVKVTPHDVDTECANLTTGGYAEAHDNGDNKGNDMIRINYDTDGPVFTTSSTDAPEPTNLTIAPGTPVRLTGNTANAPLAVMPDSYLDVDTFEIKTGATTNELTIRTDWTEANADLDMYVFEKAAAGDMTPISPASGAFSQPGPAEELVTTAVKPNTSYWVWVGSYNDSNLTPTAAAHSTTICGKAYTPPQ